MGPPREETLNRSRKATEPRPQGSGLPRPAENTRSLASRLGCLAASTRSPMAIAKELCYHTPLDMPKDRSEVLQGTLDLMVLKTLDAMGPLHGYGIARRIEQLSEAMLQLNEGTVYASLLRLAQKGWIRSEWGESENKRKARFYSITKAGQKQLAREAESWERISGVIGRLLRLERQP